MVDAKIQIGAETKAYFDKLNEIKKGTRDLESQLATLSKVSGVAFAGLAATAGAMVSQFSKFDNELRGVKTLLDESSFGAQGLNAGFKQMEKDLLKVAGAFPVGIGELNKALFDTVSAGVEAGQAVEVVGVASKLAVAGVTDVAVATDGLTSALNAFGLAGSDAEAVASKFFTAQKFGKTTVEELSRSFGLVAANAKAAGVSLDELLAATSAATTGGIRTQAAFTGLRAVLANVAKPTAEARDEAERLGIEFNSTALRSKGLQKFLEDLTSAQGFNATSAERLFGSVEALGIAQALTGQQSQKFKEILGELSDEQKSVSTLTDAYNTQNASLANQLQILRNNFQTLAIAIGSQLAPALSVAAEALAGVFEWASQNEEFVKLATAIGLGAAAMTGLTTVFGVASIAALKFRAAMLAAKVSTDVMALSVKGLLAATGIGALVVVASYVALNWNTIWPRAQQVFAAFAKNVGTLASNVGGVLSAAFTFDFAEMRRQLGQLKSTLKQGFEEAFAALPDKAGGEVFGPPDPSAYKEGLEREVDAKVSAENRKKTADEIAKAQEQQRNQTHLEVLQLQNEGASERLIQLTKQEGELKLQLLENLTSEQLDALNSRFEQVQEQIAEQRDIEAEQREILHEEILLENEEFNELQWQQQNDFLDRTESSLADSILTQRTAKRKFLQDQLKEQIASNNTFLEEQQRYSTAYATINKFMRDSEIGQSVTFFQSLQRLQQSNNVALKTIGKAAALTKIAQDTAKAATQALSAFPIPFIGPALGIAAAGAMIAFGVEQASRVTSAAKGGVITGGVPGVDSVPALLMPGELVTPSQNFEEVVNAVARDRIARGEGDSNQSGARVEAAREVTVTVAIDLSNEASRVLTVQQNEDRALGIAREGL